MSSCMFTKRETSVDPQHPVLTIKVGGYEEVLTLAELTQPVLKGNNHLIS
jgi:hypothetical protein